MGMLPRMFRATLIVVAVCVVFAILAVAVSLTQMEWSVYLIPAEYRGPVIVVYDEPGAAPPAREGWSTIYRIPADGILFLPGSKPQDWQWGRYYFEDSQGSRVKVPFRTRSRSELQVFFNKVGSGVRTVAGHPVPFSFEGFVVDVPERFGATWDHAFDAILDYACLRRHTAEEKRRASGAGTASEGDPR